jgi:hypothetical protein
MKQLKFLKTISLEGKPIWYKDCSYEVISEGEASQGRGMYKLFCEDLQLRGIDTILENNFYRVIEVQDNKQTKENIIIENNKNVSFSDKDVTKIKTSKTTNKKKKATKN